MSDRLRAGANVHGGLRVGWLEQGPACGGLDSNVWGLRGKQTSSQRHGGGRAERAATGSVWWWSVKRVRARGTAWGVEECRADGLRAAVSGSVMGAV